MPGAYAHITLVNILKEPQRLEVIPHFADSAIISVLDYFKYCELGAVSPDYPYLAVTSPKAAHWADAMHYTRAGEMIHAGVRRLRELSPAQRAKPLAWLLGYAAHVATDVTIHPVVELKVGPYETNKQAHRVCEMHQDAYIFQRLDLGEVGLSEHLDSGIGTCTDKKSGGLDREIESLWEYMLKSVHANAYAASTPDIDQWHKSFRAIVDNIAEEGNQLHPLARHVAVNAGLTYPRSDEIDFQYIENLQVPNGCLHYDSIFDRALSNVAHVWSLIGAGVMQGDERYVSAIGNWNLDTGRDPNGRLVFWS